MKLIRTFRQFQSLKFLNIKNIKKGPEVPPHQVIQPSEHALQCAQLIRGNNREPVIFIHGILRRSGTNFIGELIRLHPDLVAYPNKIYEAPFLRTTGWLIKAQEEFFSEYQRNREQIGERDFLPVFGSAFVAYLNAFVPENKQILLKVPGVQFLPYFFSIFPNEKLLIIIRDGRDVVQSTVRTWPQRKFTDVCREWSEAARNIISFADTFTSKSDSFLIAKFEDAVADSKNFVSRVGSHFGLDMERYPYEKLKEVPVKGSSSLKQDGKMTWKPIERPRYFNPVGRWSEWDSKLKKKFKNICGQTLIETGYCSDLNW